MIITIKGRRYRLSPGLTEIPGGIPGAERVQSQTGAGCSQGSERKGAGMIITIKGRRYRLSPGLTEFVRGAQYGLGLAVSMAAGILLVTAFMLAALRYGA